jgi:hypothetical protein
MNCPHCENEIESPSHVWSLSQPWHCSFCGGMFGVRPDLSTFPIPPGLKPMAPLLGEHVARRWAFYSKPNSYVYALCYPTGLPFYVGVGYGYRCFSHLAESNNQNLKIKTEKHAIILELLKTCEGVWFHFLALVPDRVRAGKIEAYWIDLLGVRSKGGMLANSAKPLPDPDESYDDQPPKIENDSLIIKSFQHPDFVLAPGRHNANRSGALRKCFACGEFGQYSAEMRHLKVLCSNCGHYLVPWTGEIDDGSNRVFFGEEVLAKS